MISAFFTKILVALAIITGIASLCVWLHEKGIRPLASLRKMSLVGICALALWAAPFIQYGSTKGGNGGTNNVPQLVINPGGGLLPLVSPGAATNAINQGGIHQQMGGTLGDVEPESIASDDVALVTSTNTPHVITAGDFERGFIQTRIGTDEEFNFTPPPDATIVNDWRAFGAGNASVKCKV